MMSVIEHKRREKSGREIDVSEPIYDLRFASRPECGSRSVIWEPAARNTERFSRHLFTSYLI
jgi:hypothetical protein